MRGAREQTRGAWELARRASLPVEWDVGPQRTAEAVVHRYALRPLGRTGEGAERWPPDCLSRTVAIGGCR